MTPLVWRIAFTVSWLLWIVLFLSMNRAIRKRDEILLNMTRIIRALAEQATARFPPMLTPREELVVGQFLHYLSVGLAGDLDSLAHASRILAAGMEDP